MDDNTKDVFTVLIPVLATIFVAWLGFNHADHQAREQASIDERRRREDLDRADRDRYADRRRAAAVGVLAGSMRFKLLADQRRAASSSVSLATFDAALVALNEAIAELVIVAPELTDVGGDLAGIASAMVVSTTEGRKGRYRWPDLETRSMTPFGSSATRRDGVWGSRRWTSRSHSMTTLATF